MQKTAYKLRFSDWSSDVCSADLFAPVKALLKRQPVQYLRGLELDDIVEQQRRKRVADRQCGVEGAPESLDRKSVEEGKSVSVRIDLGGGTYIKNKICHTDVIS